MNKIFKMVAVSALGLTLVAGAFAQAAGPQGGGVQGGAGQQGGKQGKGAGLKQMQKLETEIWTKLTPALSNDQKSKLEQINQKTKDAYKALKDKAQNGDKAAMRGEMQKIQGERRESIKALLSPDQQKSYMDLMKAAMAKIKKDKGGKG